MGVAPAMNQVFSIPYTPRGWQLEVHRQLPRHRYGVVVAHRRAGKTVLCVATLISAAIAMPGGRFAYVAPLLKQAKKVAWSMLKDMTREVPAVQFMESELSVTFPNGAVIQLYSGEQHDAMRGVGLDGLVLDEVAQFPPDAWGSSIRPTLSDRQGWALIIGTPAGLDQLHEFYQRGQDPAYPDWWSGLFPASETGVLSLDELRSAERDATSPDQFKREFMVDFTASVDDVLIPLSLVQAAMRRNKGALAEATLRIYPKTLGVDVARFGADSTVFFPRWGPQALSPVIIDSSDLMYVVGKLTHVVDQWQPDAVFIDVGGVGAGVVDRMRQLGYAIIDVNFGARASDARFANMRAQMWYGIKEWLSGGGFLPNEHRLLAEITSPTYSFDAANRIKLEAKDQMKSRLGRSPDVADALALTFAHPVSPREQDWIFSDAPPLPWQPKSDLREYDPYEEFVR